MQGVFLGATEQGAADKIFNISYGKSYYLSQVVELVQSLFFQNLKVKIHPSKINLSPRRGALDISHAVRHLCYRPQFSLIKGLERYNSWMSQHYHNEQLGTKFTPLL